MRTMRPITDELFAEHPAPEPSRLLRHKITEQLLADEELLRGESAISPCPVTGWAR